MSSSNKECNDLFGMRTKITTQNIRQSCLEDCSHQAIVLDLSVAALLGLDVTFNCSVGAATLSLS